MSRPVWPLTLCCCLLTAVPSRPGRAEVTAEQVRRALNRGVAFLLRQQQRDGSWPEISSNFPGGTTALAMLALLEAGVPANNPQIQAGLRYLRTIKPIDAPTRSIKPRTYVVALQTMVYCLAEPDRDRANILANVRWLERAQMRQEGKVGMWTYGLPPGAGDNSNTQYALLGLRAAAELGIAVDPAVWRRSRQHFLSTQRPDGSWDYGNPAHGPSGSMTAAGLSSLVICGLRLHEGKERIVNGRIQDCGLWEQADPIARALNWLGKYPEREFLTNPLSSQWTFYYLYGLERAARLTGQRFVGPHDWYRIGAEMLVKAQAVPGDSWQGTGLESNEIIATSFALLFLAKGRLPVVVNKLRHDAAGPNAAQDWNNDRHDIRNLTQFISRHWKRPMTWQVVDAKTAKVEDLLQAPVLFFNGHLPPVFSDAEKERLRDYVDQGGFIFAEACCSSKQFDRGVRALLAELFPGRPLRPLNPDHPIWKAEYVVPADGSLEGIDVGCRTSVVYSRHDLSCYWQQWGRPDTPEALQPIRLGSNVLAYATGKEMLPDKLDARKVVRLTEAGPTARWMLEIGKLKHGGDWNVAPMAVPNLMASLRDNLNLEVVLRQHELTPLDENLSRFPFVYMHGRAQFSYTDEQVTAVRKYLQRGGTLFADACCGRRPFDTAFRALAKRLFPDKPLVRIPPGDPLFGGRSPSGDPIGYDIGTVQYTRAMPQQQGEPFLEAIKLGQRWAVIYSKYDIGCALERHQSSDCRGYTHESALKIATNAILYALLH